MSKEIRNDLDYLVTQLEELINMVTTFPIDLERRGYRCKDTQKYTKGKTSVYSVQLENIEQAAKNSLKTAQKLKG